MNVAIIGAGSVAKEHLKAWAECEEIQVTGIADIRRDEAKSLCDAHGGKPYADYRKMLDEQQPAGVCVFTPPNVRLGPIQAAAERNMPVFCEKPIALSLAEADEIGRILGESGITFAVGYVLRYFPLFKALESVLDSGGIGRVQELFLKRYGAFDCRDGWQVDPDIGGGIVLEFYTHDTDIMMRLLGKPTSVYGHVHCTWPGVSAPNHATCMVRFESGATAVGMASWAAPGEFRLSVVGDEGTVSATNWNELSLKRLDSDKPECIEIPQGASPMRDEMLAFVRRAGGGRDEIADFRSGYDALALAAGIMRSAETGKAVDC